MATEKILIFDEAGNAKRMKVRIARFLDNEPVTASDKENIRTTLDVDDSLSGTFTTPLSVTSASDSSFTGGGNLNVTGGISVGTLEVTDKVSGTLNISTGSPEAIADADADDLVIGDGVLTNFGATIATNSSGQAKINFADGAGANAARGQIKYDHQFDKLSVSTAGGERVVVDEYGRLGIGTDSPGSYDGNADDLVVHTTGHTGISIRSSSAANGAIYFADGTSGDERYRGYVVYNHANNQLQFGSAAATHWVINSSGNFVSQGGGIDFGSVAGGSGTPITNGGLLDDYEAGSFVPVVADAASGGNTGSAATAAGEYTKVGRVVHFGRFEFCYLVN